MSVTLGVIRKHYCATLVRDRWACICNFDLKLPAETALKGPTQREVMEAWSKHLANTILTRLRKNKMLREGL